MSLKNRRLVERIPLRKRVKFGQGNPISFGYTFNFSQGGIGIESTRVFQPGSSIQIMIYDNGLVTKTEGNVRWVSPRLPGLRSKMGIKFTSPIRIIENNLKSAHV